jgi:peptidoglycan biosynthesis protein MviN/MurJ (putative lipid II flippase)
VPAAAVPPLVAPEANATRSSAVVAAGFLVSTALSAGLGLLIGLVLGQSPETDALLAAYSLYLVFTLFGANLRIALVPIMGPTGDEAAFRVRAADAVRRLSAFGGALALGALVLSPLLGGLLVSGQDRAAPGTAAAALALLAVASYGQVAAAAMAATLAAGRRFTASAVLYVASSAVTLGAAGLLMVVLGAVGAALGVLLGAAVLLGGHVALLRRYGFSAGPRPGLLRERATWRLVAAAAASAAVPLAYQFMLTIALTTLSGAVGTITAYSYAYFAATLLTSITAASIGFVTMPDLLDDLARRPATAALAYLRAVSPVGIFLFVPLAAATAAFGRPVLDAVLEPSLGLATVDRLWDVLLVFLLTALFWVLLTPVPTLALSLKRYRPMTIAALVALPVHAGLAVVLSALGGPVAVAAGHGAVSIGLTLAVAWAVFGRGMPSAIGAAARRGLPALALALVFPLLAITAPSGVLAAVALALVGVAAYLAAGVVLWPAMGAPVRRLLPRSR